MAGMRVSLDPQESTEAERRSMSQNFTKELIIAVSVYCWLFALGAMALL
jgi:hypothetical protein